MNRETIKGYNSSGITITTGEEYFNELSDNAEKYDELQTEIGVKDLNHFLKWCIKYRKDFINKSFDNMVNFYKKAYEELENE